MRLLFTACPALGHLLPILPVATAAAARGHDVRVATGADLAPVVARAGLRHVDVGPPSLVAGFSMIDGLADLTGRRRIPVIVGQGFAQAFASGFADGVGRLAATWRPDAIVREDMEMGSWIAAEQLGIPVAVIQATAWRPQIRRLAAPAQAILREACGLPPDPELRGHDGARWFTTRPPSLRDPAVPMPGPLRELRSAADDEVGRPSDDERTMSWLDDPIDRPRIAVTLGTVNGDRTDLLTEILAGLTRLDVDIDIVVAGADASLLGELPARIRVERYVPMSRLLPRSTLVIHHAGSGTMLAAAAAGRPMLLTPIAADQWENAAACVRAGIAVSVPAETITSDAIRAATARLLAEPAYTDRATAVAREIAAMPGPTAALDEIESMATDGLVAHT